MTDEALARAYAECERQARAHYENFPVASRLLPKEVRPHVAAIYAFARQADDFADEARYAGQDRIALIGGWQRRLHACAAARDENPVFLALGDTINTHHLPLQPFEDLLTAFRMDVTVTSYERFEDVLSYCRYSADPVGRLMLLLFGHREERLHPLSDAICTALQLTNFWQDVGIDLGKGRCYLPREDMRHFGVDDEDLAARRYTPRFADLIRFEVQRARPLFARGSALPSLLGGRLGFEIRFVVAGGTRVLDKIDAVGGDVFGRRPTLTAADWGRLLLRIAGPGGARGIRP